MVEVLGCVSSTFPACCTHYSLFLVCLPAASAVLAELTLPLKELNIQESNAPFMRGHSLYKPVCTSVYCREDAALWRCPQRVYFLPWSRRIHHGFCQTLRGLRVMGTVHASLAWWGGMPTKWLCGYSTAPLLEVFSWLLFCFSKSAFGELWVAQLAQN